ncbi:hypothetical protein [Streptacidiphilus sp. P02-A3a]|uniref:hypothetical protein n=1 Tax=Streptacidiphilus sp. P02-A3a TaxID=2704468 RepID=UPI0015FC663E|nr:hypothetical protein [Streptacidiphilus sp. P02-A3a]QMU68432.1 hypothetical protein GXP74_09530 [Streptacidiphilus sp. P02-A3a]
MRKRRTAGISLAGSLSLGLCLTALSGCGLTPQKTLTAAQLKSELLTAPVGSKPAPGGTLSPNGILNASQFVDGNFVRADRSDVTDDLAGEDFKYAAEANWEAANGTQADVFLLQFGDSDGAQGYVSDVSESTSQDRTPIEPLTTVPGVSGSEAWTAGAIDTYGNISQISWTAVGNVVVETHLYSPGRADDAEFDQLVRAQTARVTGGVDTPSPLPAPTGSAPAPAASGPARATAADQHRLLGDLVPLPGGAQPWPVTSQDGPTGIQTLPQFVNSLVDASYAKQASTEETDRGFQYAVRENWNASDGTAADVYLVQFASATGAQSFVLEYQGGSGNDVGAADSYTVPGGGDAMAFQHSALDSNGDIFTEGYAVVGDIAIDLSFWTPAKADRAAVAALVRKQYARLLADATVAAAQRGAPPLPTPDR